MPDAPILRVAVPCPLYQLFDYLPPAGDDGPFDPGMRLRVPFGRTRTVGVIVEVAAYSVLEKSRLKHAAERLDDVPALPGEIMQLAQWGAAYYHHPLGEVLASVLPVALRKGAPARLPRPECWRATAAGQSLDLDTLKRAPRQREILARLQQAPEGLARVELERERPVLPVLKAMWEKGLVECFESNRGAKAPLLRAETGSVQVPNDRGASERAQARVPLLQLNEAQQAAVTAVCETNGFAPFLLDGVTGSGKTEVYLRAIEQVVARGEQALVLVPEIALTPQLIARFDDRFGGSSEPSRRESTPNATPVVVLHSGLNDTERLHAWLKARNGLASIVLGTRSAVFTPLARPGIVIVDEEHDPSFKQQEGFRYSARDLAVWRAHALGIPVVLGSATPSLESLHNAENGRYRRLHLPERAGVAEQPHMKLLDIRGERLRDGLSPALLDSMRAHLDGGAQVLLFLNRRGFAPVLQCHDCGWIDECPRCDARMTFHQADNRQRCHHCGHEHAPPPACPDCRSESLRPVGAGTERIERALQEDFSGYSVARIDRDATRRKGSLDALLERAAGGEAQILVGTQMLAKGHHFPGVTLVAVIDADQGLFSSDFRAGERMAQTILQVAGRAGRAARAGVVLVQTRCPGNTLLQQLVTRGYGAFADEALKERELAGLPPFGSLALLRAEATRQEAPARFLEVAARLAEPPAGVQWLGPVPAPMERRAGRWRAQVMLRAAHRTPLQHFLGELVPQLGKLDLARTVRWSVDVDPSDTY